jgi:hypothetical protein
MVFQDIQGEGHLTAKSAESAKARRPNHAQARRPRDAARADGTEYPSCFSASILYQLLIGVHRWQEVFNLFSAISAISAVKQFFLFLNS